VGFGFGFGGSGFAWRIKNGWEKERGVLYKAVETVGRLSGLK